MRNWLFLVLLSGLACNEIKECELDPDLGYVGVVFYNYETGAERYTKWNLVYNDHSEYYYYNEEDSLAGFALPLTPDDSILTYYWETDSVTYDLILKYKTSNLKIYYLECEPSYEFKNLRVDTTSTLFDSVAVVGEFINKNVPVNVEVYF